ncbi:MAG: DUF1207 domain-containing protein [Gemmatimonadota bacterium]
MWGLSRQQLRIFAAFITVLLPHTLLAQTRIFPDVPAFEFPTASPRVAGLAGRLINTSIGDNEFGPEREGEAAIGEDFPVFALRQGVRPITFGFGVEVFGRFSLDDPKSSMISNDWVVRFNTHFDLRPWEFDVQVYHESSHLGDEYSATFNATRLDWTREVLGLWAGYRTGPFRIMGSVNRVLIDELHLPPWGGSLGLDYRTHAFGIIGRKVFVIGGAFAEVEQSTNWRVSSSGKLGLAFAGARPGKELRFSLIGHDGLSTQRQFFRARSRYAGVEIEFQL